MNSGGRRVLVIPAEQDHRTELYRLLMPALVRFECEAQGIPEGENIIEFVERTPFDLVVIEYPIDQPALPALLKSIRWRQSACRRTAVMLVTERVVLRRVEGYLNRGINRVVFLDSTDWELDSALGELLRVEPRISLNLPVQLVLPLAGKSERVVAQIDNVSSSGMLIRGKWDVEVGAPVAFEFTPPGEQYPLRGTAEVVRPTMREREGVIGFAVQFVRFENQGRQMLDQYISRQRLQAVAAAEESDEAAAESA